MAARARPWWVAGEWFGPRADLHPEAPEQHGQPDGEQEDAGDDGERAHHASPPVRVIAGS
jgi:hypothetical protein